MAAKNLPDRPAPQSPKSLSGLIPFLKPYRIQIGLALVFLVMQLTMLNNASASAYFALTLQNWEQGQFIRFHGLIQWMGWLWPFVLVAYLMQRLASSRTSKMGS